MANEFPDAWFDTFLSPQTAAPVDREMGFIREHMPVERFPRLLDVPCGIGRHAGPLAELGYDVLGLDRSERALAVARAAYPDVTFRALDMCELGSLEERFNGLLCLWHSFGYADPDGNRSMLADMGGLLRPGGRLLMDVYNAEAVVHLAGDATEERGGRTVRTKREWDGERLRVEIEYSGSDEVDIHDWQIYSPTEMAEAASEAGLDEVLRCAWFEPDLPPSEDHLRMQLLFEKAR